MNERIRQVRKDKGMSMQKFGDAIGISSASIAKIETGQNNPSEQTVRMICSEFNVSRVWLETGEGPMYLETQSLEEEIDARLASASPVARAALKALLLSCTDEELLVVERLAERFVEEYKNEQKNKAGD